MNERPRRLSIILKLKQDDGLIIATARQRRERQLLQFRRACGTQPRNEPKSLGDSREILKCVGSISLASIVRDLLGVRWHA
ncbi:hypothetical protein ACFB49_25210 [Sphingomonas sp. DBB INV C78]